MSCLGHLQADFKVNMARLLGGMLDCVWMWKYYEVFYILVADCDPLCNI